MRPDFVLAAGRHEALSKEKHAGLLQTYRRRSVKEIQRAIRSYERQVALHRQKLATPKAFVLEWDHLTVQEQQGLITKWQKDLARNQELAELMRSLLHKKRRPGQ